jgi:hypothetical protein
LFCLKQVSSLNPSWYQPAEIMTTVEAFRPVCASRDLVVAPEPVGLYVAGRSACSAYLSHPAEPGHAERVRRVQALYAAMLPENRARLVDETCASLIVLPGASEVPVAWLGPATTFRRLDDADTHFHSTSIYRRTPPAGCVPADATVPARK